MSVQNDTKSEGPLAGSKEAIARTPIYERNTWIKFLSPVVGVYLLIVLLELTLLNDNWQWETVWSYLFSQRIIMGVLNTLVLWVISTVIGLLLGLLTAYLRLSSIPLLRIVGYIYIWVARAVPLLVILLFIYFLAALFPTLGIALPFGPAFFEMPTNDLISSFSAAIAGLSFYLGGKSAEVFRAGLVSVDSGQFEACRSIGLSPWDTYTRVVGPQAIRVITPPLSNEVITMFKNTSLVSVIGFSELLTTVQSIYSQSFQTIPLLTVAVIWYLLLTSLAMVGQGYIEKRFGRGYSRNRKVRTKMSTSANSEFEKEHA